MKITDEEKFKLILDAANEGTTNAVEQAPDGVSELTVKVIGQMAAISAARRAIEKYEEILEKTE